MLDPSAFQGLWPPEVFVLVEHLFHRGWEVKEIAKLPSIRAQQILWWEVYEMMGFKNDLEWKHAQRIEKMMGYHSPISGPSWTLAKKETIKKYEGKCAVCGSDKDLEVHHIIPFNISRQHTDLILLCHPHHMEADRKNREDELNAIRRRNL